MQHIVQTFSVAVISSCALAIDPLLSINTEQNSVVFHNTDYGSWKISMPEAEDIKVDPEAI